MIVVVCHRCGGLSCSHLDEEDLEAKRLPKLVEARNGRIHYCYEKSGCAQADGTGCTHVVRTVARI